MYLCPNTDFKKANGLDNDEIDTITLSNDTDLPAFVLHDNFCLSERDFLLENEIMHKDDKSEHSKEHQQKDESALLTVTELLNIPEETPSSCAITITKATEADVEADTARQQQQTTEADTAKAIEADTTKSVLAKLQAEVDKERQFFLVLRRGAPLARVVKLWQRQSLTASPTSTLCVKFNGELGIDSGAISKEFLG